ncbi:MAG TPA: class I SAM-dependent methyltransferase [Polyangia bacterium]|jgi:methyltransferase (TIGR00027 family)|nr:class I SAM-dependent methyltransferase [Polyangia bacterium]
MVALWRALAEEGVTSVRDFRDPFAARLLDGRFAIALRYMRAWVARRGEPARARMAANIDTIPIRVAAIDAALVAAIAAGCKQVVILGAGLDTRAWRLPAVTGLPLFEVDHPATQAEKRERSRALPPPLARIAWTAVDFQQQSLAARLADVGHAAETPTAWVWEGVVMYLADDAVRSTLTAVRARSAPGSVLILHYHEPSLGTSARALRGMVMRAIGEPQIGVRSRATMRALVEDAGFVVQEDLDTAAQAERVHARAPDNDLARVSRILIARVK